MAKMAKMDQDATYSTLMSFWNSIFSGMIDLIGKNDSEGLRARKELTLFYNQIVKTNDRIGILQCDRKDARRVCGSMRAHGYNAIYKNTLDGTGIVMFAEQDRKAAERSYREINHIHPRNLDELILQMEASGVEPNLLKYNLKIDKYMAQELKWMAADRNINLAVQPKNDGTFDLYCQDNEGLKTMMATTLINTYWMLNGAEGERIRLKVDDFLEKSSDCIDGMQKADINGSPTYIVSTVHPDTYIYLDGTKMEYHSPIKTECVTVHSNDIAYSASKAYYLDKLDSPCCVRHGEIKGLGEHPENTKEFATLVSEKRFAYYASKPVAAKIELENEFMKFAIHSKNGPLGRNPGYKEYMNFGKSIGVADFDVWYDKVFHEQKLYRENSEKFDAVKDASRDEVETQIKAIRNNLSPDVITKESIVKAQETIDDIIKKAKSEINYKEYQPVQTRS